MNDRELLEMAAKAAEIGPKLCYESARNCLRIGDRKSYWIWSPISDDGDALRLAVKLCMSVSTGPCVATASTMHGVLRGFVAKEDTIKQCQYAATRRAIVRAAAEIGRVMALTTVGNLPEDNYDKTQAEAFYQSPESAD